MATAENTFDPQKVQQAIELAQTHSKAAGLTAATDHLNAVASGELSVMAECINITVQDGQVCVNLPLGIGHVCLPVPSVIPSGTAAEACLSICTTLGFPTGVKVTVSALGHVVITKSFGKC